MCGSKNYPYLPHGRDFSLDSPTSLEIPVKLHTFTYIFWAFEKPPPPRNFQSLLWGKYGYFLELHIVVCVLYLAFLSTVYIMQAEPHWRAPSEEVGSLVNYNNYNNKKKYNTSRVSTGHLSNEADLCESSLRQLRETPTSLTTQNFCPATN